jgi:hypothetical protein
MRPGGRIVLVGTEARSARGVERYRTNLAMKVSVAERRPKISCVATTEFWPQLKEVRG